MANYAGQSMDQVMRLIENRTRRQGANVYVGLGVQQMADITKMSTDGFPKAIRTQKNTVSLKSIYLDIDVGKPGAYATTEDAFDALDDFCGKTGMPKPTMEVYSGTGGLHVYWCFTDPIPLANWLPLARGLQAATKAHGLKCDPQVTVDPARILRVPNTFNHKKSPPTRVHLYRPPGHTFPTYGFQQMVGILGAHVSPLNAVGGVPKGNKANAQRSSNFTDGITEKAPPRPIDDLAINCAVIDDILDRGGDGDPEPLWNLALYAASFTSDPYDAAHRLSDGDARYAQADTDKKLQEKIDARAADPSRGWPTCEQFSIHHVACATCPLFALKKSPFHHMPPVAHAAQEHLEEDYVPQGQDPLMPMGYWRNKKGRIYTTLYKKTGDPYVQEVVNYQILDGGIDANDGTLLYQAMIGGTVLWRELNVGANMNPQALASALAKGNGLYIEPKAHTAARDFFVGWVGHLQTIGKYKHQGGYGWQQDGTFAFDDKVYSVNGVEPVFRGRKHDPNFVSAGTLKPWQDAMALVYGKLPLEAVVASAFAAPLVSMLGPYSSVLSVFSSGSGVGKSTAMALGQAVWGHPISGMSTLADTTNSTMKKIGDLKNLPIYWDELRTRDQLQKVVDIVFQVTQSKAKARLNKDATQQEAPQFCTMFAVASNFGIADVVYTQTESTEAGGLRVFEIEAQQRDSDMSDSQARQLLLGIMQNYGNAGPIYAAFLAQNKSTIKAMLAALDAHLASTYKLQQKERFWWITMTAILAGAQLANAIGLTDFNIPGLTDFMGEALARQRADMKDHEHTTLQTGSDVAGLLAEMIAEQRGRGLIITETIPYGLGGKPVPNNLVDTDISRVTNPWIQVGHKDKRIRIQTRAFNKWMQDHHFNPTQIIAQLRKIYHVSKGKQTIGRNVPGLDAMTRFGRCECWDFTPLPNLLNED